ncbi:oxidoreductase [Paenibacillaceae bacterium]|nr:oxidoreductase [Paenibacillaceae bacterium]
MEQVKIAEDLSFSRIIHGHWRLAEWKLRSNELLDLIRFCTEEQGITTFDHADIYGDYSCEERFGEALSLQPGIRSKMQLVTKCGIKLLSDARPEHKIKYYDTGRTHIVSSVERSLKNLRTDYIDLLLIHRPDPLMNPVQVAEAFIQLKDSGKVRYFGVSNFLPSQFRMLSSYLPFPLVTNQLEMSVAHLDSFVNGSIDLCLENRIAPMAWSPLAGGQLFHSSDDKASRLRATLEKLVHETNAQSIDQVMYAWLLHHPSKTMPIIGSGNRQRIATGVEALSISLSDQQWYEVWQSSMGKEVD